MAGIRNITLNPKLRTYKDFKTDFRLEPYLTLNLNKKIYTKIARFRCSSHSLKIETGRHERPVVPAELRICDKCTSGEVEDEQHCLIKCNTHESHRRTLYRTVREIIPNFDGLDENEKFINILKSKDSQIVIALGSFLNNVM